jgi:hypothetical protein
MRSFITEFKPGLLKRTDYILSRRYGVLTRTQYIDTNTTDSTQTRVNEESKFDNLRDKHGIYGAMIYDEHYQLDFPCYESCLLYKVTFQVMAPFDAGTKIGIFNDKAPVVIMDMHDPDMHDPDTAGEEYDYYAEINSNVVTPFESPYQNFVANVQFNDNMDAIIIPSIYNAKTTDYPTPVGGPDIYGRDTNVMPEINDPLSPSTELIKNYEVFKFTGTDYTEEPVSGVIWYFKHDQYYQVLPKGSQLRWWLPVHAYDALGYEYYLLGDDRLMPRIINVDPYETDEGAPVPIQLHARVIGNESKSAFGYLTVETFPIIRQ